MKIVNKTLFYLAIIVSCFSLSLVNVHASNPEIDISKGSQTKRLNKLEMELKSYHVGDSVTVLTGSGKFTNNFKALIQKSGLSDFLTIMKKVEGGFDVRIDQKITKEENEPFSQIPRNENAPSSDGYDYDAKSYPLWSEIDSNYRFPKSDQLDLHRGIDDMLRSFNIDPKKIKSQDGVPAKVRKARELTIQFINQAHKNNVEWVLVITGKGNHTRGDDIGKLRRDFPNWMKDDRLQGKVLAFSPAKRAAGGGDPHGGKGAWYVKLR